MESQSRYRQVTRRALLKASAGFGAALALPACGNDDVEVFAGALTDPVTSQPPTSSPPAATATATPPPLPPETVIAAPPPTARPEAPDDQEAPSPTVIEEPPTTTPAPVVPAGPAAAVAGELVISFAYTQGAGGKNERPYIAVWIENEAGELIETVSLWYQQRRRGERWLDHLDRWWDRDQTRIAAGGSDDAAVISSATRQAGAYAVAWDGTFAGAVAPAGRYFVCIESAREEGPYSLVREAFDLTGSLPESSLPDSGELSALTVRTSA